MASRLKNGRSRAARLLIDGTDPDEVMQLQKEVRSFIGSDDIFTVGGTTNSRAVFYAVVT
jgi:hypothetical protein